MVRGATALWLHRTSHGPSLGVDGKGKAPHWRLTECGRTSKASAEGLFEPPPNNFLKWDGAIRPQALSRQYGGWDVQKQNPVTDVEYTPSPTSSTPPFPTSVPPQDPKWHPRRCHRARPRVPTSATYLDYHWGPLFCCAPTLPAPPEGSLEEKTKSAISTNESSSRRNDKRLKAERRKAGGHMSATFSTSLGSFWPTMARVLARRSVHPTSTRLASLSDRERYRAHSISGEAPLT